MAACGPAAEEADGPIKPTAVAFSGKVDPRFIGHWRTADGRSDLQLGKDGAATIVAVTPGPGGGVTAKNQGSWLVDGDRLLMKYSQKGADDAVVSYRLKASGSRMTLSTKVPKTESVYVRR